MSGHGESLAPITEDDRLTAIAEGVEVALGYLLTALVIRGYSDEDVTTVVDECLQRALAAREDFPAYPLPPQ